MTVNQSTWEKMIYESSKAFEERRIKHSSLKRAHRKHDLTSVPDTLQLEHACKICRRVSVSKMVVASYMKSHESKLPETRFTKICIYQPLLSGQDVTQCQFLSRV